MPGFATHYLFGMKCLNEVEDINHKKRLSKYHNVFSLGLQGPDIFFYYPLTYLIHEKNIGSLVHGTNPGKFLKVLLYEANHYEGEDRELAFCYLEGFLGHYTLDRICHPYVYAMTDYKNATKGYFGKHVSFETEIDILLLDHWKKVKPSQFHSHKHILLSSHEKDVISNMLWKAYQVTYPDFKITKKMIRSGINSMIIGTRLLKDDTGYKKKIIEKVEKLFFKHNIISGMIMNDKIIPKKKVLNGKRKLLLNPWTNDLMKKSFHDQWLYSKGEFALMLEQTDSLYRTNQVSARDFLRKVLHSLIKDYSFHSGIDSSE